MARPRKPVGPTPPGKRGRPTTTPTPAKRPTPTRRRATPKRTTPHQRALSSTPDNVSHTLTDTIKERQQAVKRRRAVIIGIVVAALVIVGGGGYALFFSPLFAVHKDKITVKGDFTYLDSDQIAARMQAFTDRSLLTITQSQVHRQLNDMGWIDTLTVTRHYPHAMTVTITERTPVAIVTKNQQSFLVDKTATLLSTNKPFPRGLATIYINPRSSGQDSKYAQYGLDVLNSTPKAVRHQVADITVAKNRLITMRLKDGRRVMWGDTNDLDFKGQVLEPLVDVHAQEYDVSDPLNPVTSN